MKAGQALGLLAGLGALNALGGGRNGAGPRFTGLLDMLDGGGAGQSGDKFEGGGLLSVLGNLFAKPLEAQQRVEEIAARTSSRDRGSSPKPALRPTMTTGTPITEYSDSLLAPVIPTTENTAAMEDANLPAKQYSGRGNMGMPREAMQYSGRGLLDGSQGSMQYSGRGAVGMQGRTGMQYSGRGTMGMPVEPEKVYSGRGITAGGFSPNLYASMIDDLRAIDPDFVENADNNTLMDIYSTYVQNAGSLY